MNEFGKSWFVVDTVTDQGYGAYVAANHDTALAAMLGDADRDPEDGDVYHVYELTGSICPGTSIVYHENGSEPGNTLGK